jgi:hypothetical protein
LFTTGHFPAVRVVITRIIPGSQFENYTLERMQAQAIRHGFQWSATHVAGTAAVGTSGDIGEPIAT